MAVLTLDKGAQKQLKKLIKRNPEVEDRFNKTKKAFDENYLNPKLDFKKHKSLPGVFKIRLLGRDDGRRLMLTPHTDNQTYHVYDILKHDDI
jgi:hypothetical protein